MSADRPDPLPEADKSKTQDETQDPEPRQAQQRDVGAETTDRVHLGALRVLEEGPDAPRCPQGHGRLVAAVDPAVETGVSLTCPACGFHTNLALGLLHNVAHGSTASPPADQPTIRMAPVPASPASWHTQVGAAAAPGNTVPAAPARPYGTKPDGTVRTYGGVLIGGWVPAGLWSPLVGLLIGLVATRGQLWWSLLVAAIGYGLWWGAAIWVWPRSPAVNRYRVNAEDLRPGLWIRLHGWFGPAGRVEGVSTTGLGAAGDRWIRIGFAGGMYLDLPGKHPCHVVELRR